MRRLVWFRQDLRIHDNETLTAAVNGADGPIAYVYFINQEKTGPHRAKFLSESLADLQSNLHQRGADLICLSGSAADFLPRICEQFAITDVYYSRLTSFNELQEEQTVLEAINGSGLRAHGFHTSTLIHPMDVDFDIFAPVSFSRMKKLIEKSWPVRSAMKAPLKLPPSVQHESSPPISVPVVRDKRGIRFEGGETAGLQRVQQYFWEGDHLKQYKSTRNNIIGIDASSKFSPYLSVGCISPRFLYEQVRRYETERVRNGSTLWFLYELLWRDHFHFLARERGAKLFTQKAALAEANPTEQESNFDKWRSGRTGTAFIDAGMTELMMTGWLSNRMRQNAASFLVHDLRVDWRWGAAHFESQLIDYDPCSNWGNWQYIAGADLQQTLHKFNIEQQQNMFDGDGEYRRLWAPSKSS